MSRTAPISVGDDRGLLAAPGGVVGEPGGDEGQREVGRGRCSGSAGRRASPRRRGVGGEQLAERRRVDGADEHPVGVGGGDRRRPQRQVVDEVGRAVDRVDVPRDARRAGAVGALLADDGVVGPGRGEAGDDRRLGGPVEAVTRSVAVDLVPGVDGPRRAPAGEGGVAGRHGEPAGEARAARRSAVAVIDGSRSWISRHSPRARSTSTATMLIPAAVATAPTRIPSPSGQRRSRRRTAARRGCSRSAPPASPATQDGDEGGGPGGGGGQRRQRLLGGSVHGAEATGRCRGVPGRRRAVVSCRRRAGRGRRADVQRGRRTSPSWSPCCARRCPTSAIARRRRRQPRRHGRRRPARSPPSTATSRCSCAPGRRGLGSAYRDGLPPGDRRRRRRVRADRRRPVPRPGRPAGPARQRRARRRPGHRQPLRARRAHRELVVAAALAVAVGQPLRRRRARARRQRRHRRLPRLPGRRARGDGLRGRSRPRATASRSR